MITKFKIFEYMKHLHKYENFEDEKYLLADMKKIVKDFLVVETDEAFLIWELVDRSDPWNIELRVRRKYNKDNQKIIHSDSNCFVGVNNVKMWNENPDKFFQTDSFEDAVDYVEMKFAAKNYNL
jgi:hypothetical protein